MTEWRFNGEMKSKPQNKVCQILRFPGVVCTTLLLILSNLVGTAAERPNILWITAEDMSSNLRCYGDNFARTPNLDAFARRSVRYLNAYATAPVCSPSRSCLITGVYASALGTQSLRSAFPIPAHIKGWPSYLRKVGYYTSNNVKTDYNTSDESRLIEESWDESSATAHWRNRAKKAQPFFSIFNLMTTHQSRTGVWPWEEFEKEIGSKLSPGERSNQAKVPLPPYYPDTPLVRKYMARYYDCVHLMDRQVGDLLQQLQHDGLADNTIVFFYSDHGMGMPRGKRVLHDSGMQVPLMIHFPEQYQHLAPQEMGTTTKQLVSFVDFPPSVLTLLGLKIPPYMQGQPFLGPANSTVRQYVYGTRDRVDEVYELARSVRDGRYLYIRNYMPHLSWAQPERYSDNAEFRREILQLAKAGKLNKTQMTYAGPSKPIEELYDTQADKHQVDNLADSTRHQEILRRLRTENQRHLSSLKDLAFLPEYEVWKRIAKQGTPYDLRSNANKYPFEKIVNAASLVGMERAAEFRVGLKDLEPAVRYWSAMGLRASSTKTTSSKIALKEALNDTSPVVRIEAADALIAKGEGSAGMPVLREELDNNDLNVALMAARALQQAGNRARGAAGQMKTKAEEAKAKIGEDPLWMFVQFALEEALEQMINSK